ncbi:MAG: VTT domain-containing protein [Cytophagaceae bacterium]|jgi:membrane-associated protein|nr:VTT domain-containing protein [Cytophagaceae bacterium]
MEYVDLFVGLFTNLQGTLQAFIDMLGPWIYVLLFAIIFAETGLVVTPFLPGDSLLFVIGMFTAIGLLSFPITFCVLLLAAILGDTVNYHVGKFIGPKAFSSNSRFFKKQHLLKAQSFYEKHGPQTIIMARFVPIVRTFAPFVAGIGTMNYRKFVIYNIIGALIWVLGILIAGYFLGEIEWVKKNLEKVILLIVGISVLPIVWEYLRQLNIFKTTSK